MKIIKAWDNSGKLIYNKEYDESKELLKELIKATKENKPK